MVSREAVEILTWALGVISGAVFLLATLAIWDAVADLKVARRHNPTLGRIAWLRLVRHCSWLISSGLLFFLVVLILLQIWREVRVWTTIVSFFDFPVSGLVILSYDRAVQRRNRRSNEPPASR